MVQVMHYEKLTNVVALVVISRVVFWRGFNKARHLAGGVQRVNIARTCMEEKHQIMGLERNRNCEY